MGLPTFEPWTELTESMLQKEEEFTAILQQHTHPDWIKSDEIAVRLGWVVSAGRNRGKPETSMVRLMVAYLRIQHQMPIASQGAGYCVATRPEHLDLTIAQLQGRLTKQRMTCDAVVRARRNLRAGALDQLRIPF